MKDPFVTYRWPGIIDEAYHYNFNHHNLEYKTDVQSENALKFEQEYHITEKMMYGELCRITKIYHSDDNWGYWAGIEFFNPDIQKRFKKYMKNTKAYFHILERQTSNFKTPTPIEIAKWRMKYKDNKAATKALKRAANHKINSEE